LHLNTPQLSRLSFFKPTNYFLLLKTCIYLKTIDDLVYFVVGQKPFPMCDNLLSKDTYISFLKENEIQLCTCHAQYVEGWELVYICKCWEVAKLMGECLVFPLSLPCASIYCSPSPPALPLPHASVKHLPTFHAWALNSCWTLKFFLISLVCKLENNNFFALGRIGVNDSRFVSFLSSLVKMIYYNSTWASSWIVNYFINFQKLNSIFIHM
jgi:hypothetical protein